jgi:N-acyl homoserine lactone hydrolase
MKRILVRPLCIGHIVRDGKTVVEAHSSSTLVQVGERSIVVDTSDKQNRDLMVQRVQEYGLDPEDVEFVINTHLHGDHIGNNDLFPHAKVLVHALEKPGPGHLSVRGATFHVLDGVKVVHTPGHTPGSVSVFVRGDRRIAIVGDAIPTIDNYLKRSPPSISFDAELALNSMERIIEWAEVVVPGHGGSFDVQD